MVFVLDAPKSPGGSFLQGLGSGVAQTLPKSISDMFQQRNESKQIDKILGPALRGESNLDWKHLLALQQAGLGEHAKTLAPFVESQHKQQLASKAAEQESAQQKQHYSGIIKKLEELKSYAGSTRIPFTKSFNAHPEGMNREGLEKRSEIDTLSLTLEGVLRDLSTKGSLPQKTFQELLKRIPKATDSEREYQGKLNAFKQILGIVPPEAKQQIMNAMEGEEPERPSLSEIFK